MHLIINLFTAEGDGGDCQIGASVTFAVSSVSKAILFSVFPLIRKPVRITYILAWVHLVEAHGLVIEITFKSFC